ncbi:MAG TPA: hypothetical protein VNF06_03085 [Candidatus Aquilonibacter sp.]|nr:hypothetical protein [Candidatus Aquilonibacter sp.]
MQKILTKEQEPIFANTVAQQIISIYNESKDKRGAVTRDIPLTLKLAYQTTGERERLVAMTLTIAYESTKNEVFEQIKRDSIRSIFIGD